MKTRIGFVSNSSTSSFCIYGISIDKDKLKENLKIRGEWKEEYNKYFHVQDWFADNFEKERFICRCPYDHSYYIGIPWCEIGDDETGGQFKKKIEDRLKPLFGNDIELETLEAAWNDG